MGPNCPTNGAACSSTVMANFKAQVAALPGGSASAVKGLTVIAGAGTHGCTVNAAYVTVQSQYQFNFVTPGLYQVVSLAAQAASGWLLTTKATARCEIAR